MPPQYRVGVVAAHDHGTVAVPVAHPLAAAPPCRRVGAHPPLEQRESEGCRPPIERAQGENRVADVHHIGRALTVHDDAAVPVDVAVEGDEPETIADSRRRPARDIGVTSHVLRHWEHERVLVPARDEYGHRRYSSADLAVAAGIRRAQAAGLTLAQVRDFLGGDADARAALLAAHRRDLDAHRDALARASADVTAALGAPVDPHCPYGV